MHLSITHGTLIENEALSVNRLENFLDSNLIIQGDNLIALKSLIPFSGGVDCVLIDRRTILVRKTGAIMTT